MRTIINKKSNNEDGQAAIFIALFLVVLLTMTALVVDFGLYYYKKSRLQTAVDAAVLAAAYNLPDTDAARDTVYRYIENNGCSTDDVVIEFLDNNTKVRASAKDKHNTSFARIVGKNTLTAEVTAAATLQSSPSQLNFKYQLFSGSKKQNLDLGGMYTINGDVHTNASANIGGNTSARVNGSVEACGSAVSVNNLVNGTLAPGSSFVTMPDFDAQIMELCPTFPYSAFNVKDYWKVPDNTCYMSSTNRNQALYYSKIATSANPLVISNSIYVPDGFVNPWIKTEVHGSVYSNGDALFSKDVSIRGNLFANGNLTNGGGTSIIIDGDVYCTGNILLNGPINRFCGNLYCEGNITLGGGATLYLAGNLYCKGNVSMQTSQKTIGGSIYSLGSTVIFGLADVAGDIYSGGNLVFSGNYPSVTTHGGAIYTGGTFRSDQGFNTTGIFVAEGNVTIGGRPSLIESNSTSSLALYSRNGDIFMSPGSGMIAYGMVYAPKGKISFESGSMTFYGSIIGDSIQCRPGGLLLEENNERPLPFASASTPKAVLVE